MIISVHIGKTAGSSFLATLKNHFGRKLLEDYNDIGVKQISAASSKYEKYKEILKASVDLAEKDWSNIECIHGHILPLKYLLTGYRYQAKFVVWIRNPVERLYSHYYYWKRSYDPRKSDDLQRKVIEEKWSIERFCLDPEFKNHYCGKFWGFPLEYFDFIGITEFYENDLAYFARHFLGSETEAKKINVGENEGKPYFIDESFRKEVESFHSLDMALYRRALEIRQIQRGNTIGNPKYHLS